MASNQDQQKDHWSTEAYSAAANFVPKLTATVISYLDAQPQDRILDLGCGDGQLTAQIAQSAFSGQVLGVDSSQSFLQTAQERFSTPNCTFKLHDATALESCDEAVNGQWDKVFSNAAMHWILRNPDTRTGFFENAHRALKPEGTFVFEMGGHGNVGEIYAATLAALLHAGIPLDRARQASPWFFPSTDWMSAKLADVGFDVEICEIEYRPTKLTEKTANNGGGIEGWVKLMCADFLEVVEDGKKEKVVKEICDVVETIITRGEDGSKWIGYVRLRARARKR